MNISNFYGLRIARELFPRSIVLPLMIAVAVLAFFFALSVVARAEDGTAAVVSSGFSILSLPSIVLYTGLTVVFGVLTVQSNRLVSAILDLLGIKDVSQRASLEATYSDRLHTAALNGLKFAFARAGLPPSLAALPTVLTEAVNYVLDKNPDTLEYLGTTAEQVEHIVQAKIHDLVGYGGWISGTVETTAPPDVAKAA